MNQALLRDPLRRDIYEYVRANPDARMRDYCREHPDRDPRHVRAAFHRLNGRAIRVSARMTGEGGSPVNCYRVI